MLILYRIYQFLIMFPILLVLTIVTALVTIIGSFMGLGRWFGYYVPKWWARLFCWLTFVRVTVKGRQNISPRQSYVFVANHQSAYDIFSLYGFINHQFRWMMKKDLERIPLIGLSCKMSGQIFVDRSSPAAVRHTMKTAEKQLQGGMSLIVFPEGSRTHTGRIRPFKRGAYKLAAEFGLPLVPVTIDGAFEVFPRFKKLPKWGHIKLTIHHPIAPPADDQQLQEAMDATFAAISSSLPDNRKG